MAESSNDFLLVQITDMRLQASNGEHLFVHVQRFISGHRHACRRPFVKVMQSIRLSKIFQFYYYISRTFLCQLPFYFPDCYI